MNLDFTLSGDGFPKSHYRTRNRDKLFEQTFALAAGQNRPTTIPPRLGNENPMTLMLTVGGSLVDLTVQSSGNVQSLRLAPGINIIPIPATSATIFLVTQEPTNDTIVTMRIF